ncbi:MAG: hypothetical protein ABIH42_08325, partial [Planctomycetota bacterium]
MQVSRVKANIVVLLIAAAFLLLIGRLYKIQRVLAMQYTEIADKQHRGVEVIPPVRGNLYTLDKEILATSLKVSSAYLDSRFVENTEETVSLLTQVLHLSDKEIRTICEKLAKGSRFIWVKRRLLDSEKRVLSQLNIPGVYFEDEFKRYYPGQRFA